MEIAFGDRARVLATSETIHLGFADRVGMVHGITTPSITSVEVIGGCDLDIAFNLVFEDDKRTVWFAPHLLEFVDHAPGTEIVIGGKKLVRSASGEWVKS